MLLLLCLVKVVNFPNFKLYYKLPLLCNCPSKTLFSWVWPKIFCIMWGTDELIAIFYVSVQIEQEALAPWTPWTLPVTQMTATESQTNELQVRWIFTSGLQARPDLGKALERAKSVQRKRHRIRKRNTWTVQLWLYSCNA